MPARRKVLITAVLVAALAVLIVIDRQGWLLVPAGDDLATYHDQSFLVTRVIDGDTVEIAAVDRLTGELGTHVRLWGIDCPEMARDDQPAEPWAAEATQFTGARCQGEPVVVKLEAHRLRDTYGRLLAHLITEDGVNVSEALLREGLAYADDRWKHDMIERYRQAEAEARTENAGLWSNGSRPAHAPGR